MKVPTFRQNDIPIAIATLVQVLVVQLIDSEVLTVEEAEQVFDGAAKRAARLKDTAPDAERVIHHLHDALIGTSITNGRRTAGAANMAKRETDFDPNTISIRIVVSRGWLWELRRHEFGWHS